MDDATALQLCLERDRLLNDPDFARSPSMCKLLRFLVDYKLSGNTNPLKSYIIATDALGRDADFDTQADSYPRVQMGRLRKLLDNFYLRKGGENRLSLAPNKYEIILEPNVPRAEPLEQLIGKRMHYPRFEPPVNGEPVDDPEPEDKNSANNVGNIIGLFALAAVLGIWMYLLWPDAQAGEINYPIVALEVLDDTIEADSVELVESIENHMVRGLNGFGAIRVFAIDSDQAQNSGYVIRMRFLDAGEPQVQLRLLDRNSGEILWSSEFETSDPEKLQLDMDKAIVALAGNYGEIAQSEMSKVENDFSPGYPCLLQFDIYARYREPEQLEPVLRCLHKSVERYPGDAQLLSVVAFAQNMSQRLDTDYKIKGSGMEFARRAEALDHNSGAANFAVSQAAFFEGDCSTGLAWGEKAMALNPQNSRITGYLGVYMIGCRIPGGEVYASRALELDPNADLTIVAALALQLLRQRKPEAARELSASYMAASPRDEPALELTYVVASAMLGDKAEARRIWKTLAERYGMSENSPPREVLSKWLAGPIIINEVMTALDRTEMFKD